MYIDKFFIFNFPFLIYTFIYIILQACPPVCQYDLKLFDDNFHECVKVDIQFLSYNIFLQRYGKNVVNS